MKVWVSKHTYCCRTPKQINETPMADLRHRVGGPPQVFHQLVWVYGGKMGASTPTVSYNSPPMKTTFFNSYEDTARPPQCHNFGSTAGAGGFTAGAAALAVNMLEEALHVGGCPRFFN